MKKLFIHIIFILLSSAGYGQLVFIPDTEFVTFLKTNSTCSSAMVGDQLDTIKAAFVTGNISGQNSTITNLEGIQYFSKVTKINFGNSQIASMPPLQKMAALETVHLYGNKLTAAPDFRNMMNLKTVLLYENQLTAMPLFGNNPIIEEIIIYKNNISTITSLFGLETLVKLDVGENQLTELPDLSSNINLEQLICWSNKLTVLPSLTELKKLWRLNAGKNKLTQFPDLSANKQLTSLALDNNLLTTIPPNIIGSTNYNFTSVKLYNNYFTFKNLGPYAGVLTASNIYAYTPMLHPKGDTIDAYYNESVVLHSHVDNIVANVTYDWYEGTTSIDSGLTDAVTISQGSSAGITNRYVYAKITHASLTSLTLVTDTFLVRFNPCPVSSDISYKATKTDCGNSGAVEVNVQGYVAPQTNYMLTSKSFGTNEYYTSNNITGLIDTAYSLQIDFSPTCILNYNTSIKMPAVDCGETFMTPNNDGDADTYLFTGKGTVVIYDKYGKEVKRATLPYEWDGSGQRGLVQPGYYIGVVNGGKDRINISVLY